MVLLVTLDRTRVFVGGGEYGYEGIAREVDVTGIEALHERFGFIELAQVLANLRAAAPRA